MTSLYTIFHGNLQFSSIPENQYKTVIDNCYWPLIRILDKNKKLKLGIEFSGLTLLEIEKLDKKFLEKIKKLIKEERLEFIGSSYTQTIFPLIPYEVNLKNLELGMNIYKEVLGVLPKIIYVNEQTFSDGLISLYKKIGIENIVIDFDSAPENIRTNTTLLYKPIKASSQDGNTINVIWSSSIAFQKFQRYIFDEISYEDYLQYLSTYFSRKKNGSFCLYGGDWEVFGFSPKGITRDYKNDFQRITELFDKLSIDKDINFVLPSQLIKRGAANFATSITDFQDPILCKKQEKYNISRWALAGKKTIFRNTQCFRLFKAIEELKDTKKPDKITVDKLKKNLVRLWGSDYRTNTTDDKNREYDNLLAKTQKTIKKYASRTYGLQVIADTNFRNEYRITTEENWTTKNVKLTLDSRKGASIKELIFPKIFPKKMAGLIPHGYFQNQQLSADWFSGHCLFETDSGKHTDLYPTKMFIKKSNNGDINLFSEIKTPIGTIRKNYKVYQDLPKVDLQYVFNFKKVGLKSARIGNITLDPVNFDHSNLWYATVNGGKSKEVYKIGNSLVAQDEIVSFRISSKGCLGATNGWVAVGDNKKGILLTWDKAEIAGCPLVHFENTPQGLYGRIQPSIAETDETGFSTFEGKYTFCIYYLGITKVEKIDQVNIHY